MASRFDKIPTKNQAEIRKELNAIANRIQKSRLKLGLTQEELAEKLDISVGTVQRIEQSSRYPSLPMLSYICRELGIKITIG